MSRRGDVFLVSLDPVVGSEIGKTRPAIVVQNEMAQPLEPHRDHHSDLLQR